MSADFSRVGVRLAAAFLLAMGAGWAQQSLDSKFRLSGPEVVAAFEAQRAVLQKSSAVVMDGRREAGFGVVVSADGHVLAKASEVAVLKKPEIIIDRTRYREVAVLGEDPGWDVVLLKVSASGLVPVVYAPGDEVPQGTWVVANGATSRFVRRARVGIVSAKVREIPAAGGAALGVVLKVGSKVLEIDQVGETSGAKAAGLKKGDVIVAVDGKPVGQVGDLAEVLKDRKAGSRVKVRYRREGREAVVEVELAAKAELFSNPEMMNRNDQMSGDFSRRRSGFPRVLQHDILGNSSSVGGPLLDLDGRCVGMNIARANRAESFAIPAEDLQAVAGRLLREAAAVVPGAAAPAVPEGPQ